MIPAITIVSMLIIVLAMWFLGLWNNVVTLVNLLLATLIASNWFEPLASLLDGGTSSYTYLLDFVSIWLLFFGSFTVLRVTTDFLSRVRIEFDRWVDMGLRTVICLVTAWVFASFLQFTMHLAPLPPAEFQADPMTVNFAGSPDRVWMGFLQGRSRGALAASLNEPLSGEYIRSDLHDRDADLNARVFDSRGDFIFKYHDRRRRLSEENDLRVRR